MAGLDLETLFDLEGAIEPVVAAALHTPEAPLFTPRSLEVMPDRRIEFQFLLGNVTDHMFPGANGTYYDRWNAQFLFQIVTPRSATGTQAKWHSQMRARLRVALQYGQQLFTPQNLPYHEILSLREHGTDPRIDAADDLDISELRFAAVAGIRFTAWALLPPPGA